MTSYRDALPQLERRLFLTDGGLETTMIYQRGLELPDFASFQLLATEEGEAALEHYFRSFVAIARKHGTGLILESATWRASADWGERLGYTAEAMARVNRRAVEMLEPIRRELDSVQTPCVVSGCLGPRGDGYVPNALMSAEDAERYHMPQAQALADADVDMLCAMTLNYAEEAIGIAGAAAKIGIPLAIAFTVETDAKLPTGQTLRGAIDQVEQATGGSPAYYMINCAHPSHFEPALAEAGPWRDRIRGIRANASHRSHAELNESTELDAGDPEGLAADYERLLRMLPQLTILGGCCGTDERHIDRIAARCAPLLRSARP